MQHQIAITEAKKCVLERGKKLFYLNRKASLVISTVLGHLNTYCIAYWDFKSQGQLKCRMDMQERRFISSTGLAPKDANELFSADVWVTLLFVCLFNLIYTEGNLFPLFLPVTACGNIPAINIACFSLQTDNWVTKLVGAIKLSGKAAPFLPWLYEGSKMSINGSQKHLRSLCGSRNFFSKVVKQVLNYSYLIFPEPVLWNLHPSQTDVYYYNVFCWFYALKLSRQALAL